MGDLYNETNVNYDNAMYRNWGKANTSAEGTIIDYHLLVYHCLDVAAVGNVLLKRNDFLLKKFIDITSFDEETTISLLTFFLSIHDIGKFSDRFQNLQPELIKSLRGHGCDKKYTMRHDSMGHLLWGGKGTIWDTVWDENYLGLNKQDYDKYDWKMVIDPWIQAVVGHHGKPPKDDIHGIPMSQTDVFGEEDIEMALSFVKEASSLFLNPEFQFPLILMENTIDPIDDLISAFKSTSWLLAGLVILSDWIGSDSDYFKYLSKPIPLEEYWRQYALPNAELAVKDAGVLPSIVSQDTGMSALFPSIRNPSPLQSHVSTCQIELGAQLFILEEATGSGKTEAALTLAHRMMKIGIASGIFVALPTMATSNAMYERMTKAYQRMFDTGSEPSLVLAHSGRHLIDNFSHSVGLKVSHEKESYDSSNETVQDETVSVQCNRWIADNRKKALLADVGVGTVDQALMSVLPFNHQSLRLLGLARNVLIVDEVHAYDPYMHRLLCNLLEFQASLGGNVILLSATLPMNQRQKLANSFCKGIHSDCVSLDGTDFPLVTHVSRNGMSEIPVDSRKGTRREVEVEFFDEISDVENKIINVSRDGKCVCWVRNTVGDAVEAYENLVTRLGEEKVILFHARFAMFDRLDIEKDVLDLFGKESDDAIREGKVLVATQVVEQSLDLDFDYMVSDLAPIDLILQRSGRLQRHSGRGDRGTPILGIFTPELTDSPSENWYSDTFSNAAYVYPSHGRLWMTAKLLSERGMFIIPDDARDLIEGVFGDEIYEQIPAGLKDVENKAEGDRMGDKSIAGLNQLDFNTGYKRTVVKWLDDTLTPTRVGEASSSVRLAKWNGESLSPWANTNKYPWELSQVSISEYKISSTGEYDQDLREAIKTSLDSMPDKGKWCVLIPLKNIDGNEWEGSAKNKRGKDVVVKYNQKTGLRVQYE